ncbi:MAG TPA: GDSL-type esterase/lipase family protein [Phycisphaerae bacterium]|nr:GDSL-type esterase/lipase family protein [Phycisphaerae bacterium]HRY69277.1 GDSL-type esterase/lipase family protein [Phycisphaerae bacterium]HSA26595.1 GDSL-type esterase/lipase family protein [Phycisphaerae bacterium]
MDQTNTTWQWTIAVGMVIGAVLVAGMAATSDDKKSGPPAAQPPPTADKWVRHYYDRVARFRQENAAAKNIVMVGSSHVEGFDASKLLPGRRVVNRGIASDRIGIEDRGVLHRLDSSIFDCNPGFIILENGVNDLGELWRNGKPSMNEIDRCYRKVVKEIRTRLPDVPLVIVGLFPTRDRFSPLTTYVADFNKRLEMTAADFKCPFIDVYTPFADTQGQLRKDLSRDGLHLNEPGYRLWAELINRVLPPLATATAPEAVGRTP